MASRRRYTQSNPDPNTPTIGDTPNTTSRVTQRFSEISCTPSHSKYFLSEFSRSPIDKKVDDKIHEVMFRSENEEELIDVILDLQNRGIDTSALVSQEDKEEVWEVATSELLLEREALDNLKEHDPFELLLKSKAGLPFPN